MALFETIDYDLIKKEKNIEIRAYNDILLISTKTVLTTQQDSGFNKLFNYITGSNRQKSKISMTTPVITYEEDQKLITNFYVPSKFDKQTIPTPLEESVYVNELKKSYYAVIRFKGKWTHKNFDKHDQILLAYMTLNHHEITSQRMIMRYNPPFIPGIFRHNEIAYQIIDKQQA